MTYINIWELASDLYYLLTYINNWRFTDDL